MTVEVFTAELDFKTQSFKLKKRLVNVAIRYVWYDMQIKQYFREIKIFELTWKLQVPKSLSGLKIW